MYINSAPEMDHEGSGKWMNLGKTKTGRHTTFLQVFLSSAWQLAGAATAPALSVPTQRSSALPASVIVRWSQDVVIWAAVGILGWANGDAPPRDRSSGVSLGKCALIWDRLFLTRF